MFYLCFIALMPEHGFFKIKLQGSDSGIDAIQHKMVVLTMYYADIIPLIMIPKMFQNEPYHQHTDAFQQCITVQNIME